ncbi:MAG TPA: pentapeptide repeat-containing protein [Alphaproteobacteria bacterium]
MVDKALEAMLKSGVNVWNEWRGAHPDTTAALPGAHLCGVDLIGANLAEADLRKADLRGANLSDAILAGAHLGGANFFKAILDRADVASADLTGAQFLTGAQLKTTRNWQTAYRDLELACGAPIPRSRG